MLMSPICILTARTNGSLLSALRNAGTGAYWRKPLRPSELQAPVDRLLSRMPHQTGPIHLYPTLPPVPEAPQDIVMLLGPQRVAAGRSRLVEELRALVPIRPSDAAALEQLVDRANAIISTASMLQLTELAEACRDVENPCRDGGASTAALFRLNAAVEDALKTTEVLKSN